MTFKSEISIGTKIYGIDDAVGTVKSFTLNADKTKIFHVLWDGEVNTTPMSEKWIRGYFFENPLSKTSAA